MRPGTFSCIHGEIKAEDVVATQSIGQNSLLSLLEKLEEDGFTVIFDWNAKTLTDFQRLNGGQESI